MASTTIAIPQQEIQLLRNDGEMMRSELRAIIVTDDDTCNMASNALKRRMEWTKRVQEKFKPIKKAADDVHGMIVNLEREVLATGAADAETTRISRDNFLRLREQERVRKQNELIAEQRRIEEESRAAAAKQAQDLGASPEAVQRVQEERIPLPPPIVAPVENPEGTYKRENWKWRFEASEQAAMEAIITAIRASKSKEHIRMLMGYLTFNTGALNLAARGQKSAANVPGIQFYKEDKYVDRT